VQPLDHRHATTEDLIHHVAAFEADINAGPCAAADRLWVKDRLEPEEEKLHFSKIDATQQQSPT
jgi:hypothetical protein